MTSPLIVLAASNTEASEWRHSIWQQMLSATIPYKYSKTFINQASLQNESWPDGRAKYVPNGLRVVETLLLREYTENEVVTCYVENLDKFVGPDPNGSSIPVFDSASWGSAARNDASWGTASWGTASWGTASWGTASWSSASWGTASWGTASWGTSALGAASWGTASWGSAATADNAAGDAGAPVLLDPLDEAEAEAELGIVVAPDGTVTVPGQP